MAMERNFLGRSFVTTCNEFLLLESNSQEFDMKYLVSKNKYERLLVLLKNAPPESEEEFCEIEAWHEMVPKIELKKRAAMVEDCIPSNFTKIKLPTLEMKKFDVSPRTWIGFWSQFEVIHRNDKLRPEEKFQYLLQSLQENTKAKRVAETYPPNSANYNNCIQALKSRFGRETMIIEACTSDLLSLVLANRERRPNLSNLFDTLSSKIRALETLGVTSDNFSAVLYPLVLGTLPADVVKQWERYRAQINNVNGSISDLDCNSYANLANPLNTLLEFLENEVLMEERVQLSVKKSEPQQRNFQSVEQQSSFVKPTAAALMSVTASCIFCDAGHASQECEKANTMNYSDKIERIRRANRCFRCLRGGHRNKHCRARVSCVHCQRGHNSILCRQKSTPTLYAGEIKGQVFLKTLMVKTPKGRYVRVLLDDGSSRSYIKDSLSSELGLTPTSQETMSRSLFGGITTASETVKVFSVKVGSLDGNFQIEMSCLSAKEICCTIPRVRDDKLLRQLEARGIYLSDMGSGDPQIEILIGAQGLGALMGEHNVVLPCGVTAMQTKLGWCIIGAIEGREISKKASHCLFTKEVELWQLETIGIESPSSSVVSEVDIARQREGILEKVIGEEDGAKLNYLPHRPVFKANSSTTVRPVFDALAKKDRLDWNRIIEETAIDRIKWKMNPPTAPWWGGWWERLISCVKMSIKKTLGRACLTYEEMLTVLADCESVINMRPLTYVSSDEKEPGPITPWMFLCETKEPNAVDLDEVDAVSLLKCVQHVRRIRDALRERFRQEHIGALASRPRLAHGEVSPGDVVLVGSDNTKRILWPLAKVIEVIDGVDGECRVVKLKVQGGEIVRPIQRVYPLEVKDAHFQASKEKDKGSSSRRLPKEKSKSSKTSAQTQTKAGRLVRRPSRLDL